jgi:hypothetical protein
MINKKLKSASFVLSLALVAIAIALSVATYNRWLELRFEVGPTYFSHLLGWIGTLFIAIYSPIYLCLKHRRPNILKSLINVHSYGNLIAFVFISMHFAQQMGRPADFFPNLGTGLALFIAACILVVTGILRRFQLGKQLLGYYRTLHAGATVTFYIIIIIHILHGVGII